ncbi:hypothetical protein [Coleofasciculus sp. F4-SAH-05]|uniref:hypothetical protein n=1 Tax=Coleofasciculus sp. F4-SAH-05 TaxID=3069525 RepID=UPI0032FFAC2E
MSTSLGYTEKKIPVHLIQNKPSLRRLDLCIFFILFALILFYQLQLASPLMLFIFKARYALYAYLYLRIAIFYRLRLTQKQLLLFTFLLYAVFVTSHTYFLYGSQVALAGFTRFVNVALIAPIASILFKRINESKIFVYFWLLVVWLGSLTLVYQLLGGELSWLVRDYIAIRGSLIRFKSLLGEPNIGGMASSIIYAFAILAIRSFAVQIALLVVALIFLVFSLSKAAMAGWIIATVIILLLKLTKKKYTLKLKKNIINKYTIILIFFLLLFVFSVTYPSAVQEYFVKYGQTALIAFTGGDTGEGTAYSVLEDLSMRMIGITQQGISLAMEKSSFYPLNFLVGSSFGLAGSAALELKEDALLPHNTFSEIYFVGGFFMLLLFLLILTKTLFALWLRRTVNHYYQALFVTFFVIVAFMPSYPIIYEPILGSLFWLIVGLVANSCLSIKNIV